VVLGATKAKDEEGAAHQETSTGARGLDRAKANSIKINGITEAQVIRLRLEDVRTIVRFIIGAVMVGNATDSTDSFHPSYVSLNGILHCDVFSHAECQCQTAAWRNN